MNDASLIVYPGCFLCPLWVCSGVTEGLVHHLRKLGSATLAWSESGSDSTQRLRDPLERLWAGSIFFIMINLVYIVDWTCGFKLCSTL